MLGIYTYGAAAVTVCVTAYVIWLSGANFNENTKTRQEANEYRQTIERMGHAGEDLIDDATVLERLHNIGSK
jgi:hypothetical protein